MAKFLVQKSSPLFGEVEISGSKNAVLPIIAAALLSDGKCEITDVPALRDVDVMCDLLRSLGADVDKNYDQNTLQIETRKITSCEAPYELVKRMRASALVMGPLLAKTGRAVIQTYTPKNEVRYENY